MTNNPYVSVVIVGRNDGYGDDFVGRINTFVRALDHQVTRYPGVFELIIVEWNPPGDYAPLSDVIDDTKNLPIKVITVPESLHNTLDAKHPVLEFHAKNVGIRRARGEFALVTNPDILFTQDLIDEIAKKKLRLDTVYRTDRCDFTIDGIKDVANDDLIAFAVKNTFVVHSMDGQASVSVPVQESDRELSRLPRSRIGQDVWHTNGAGDFMLASRENFFTVRGLYETLEHRWHIDSISLFRFGIARIRQHVFTAPMCIFHQHHDRRPEDVAFLSLDIGSLARRPGSTNWGFKDQTFVETIKDPR